MKITMGMPKITPNTMLLKKSIADVVEISGLSPYA
jgi:hypothetical protein